MHCKHCGCWVAAVLMPLASDQERGIPLCSTVGTCDLIWKWNVRTVFCKGGTVSECPFLTQNDMLKSWEYCPDWLQVDSRALMTLSPAKQRFEPWPPEFHVCTIVSGHHSLKASLSHSTDLETHFDLVLVKLKCWGFSTLGGKNLPCFFQLYHLSCYHCISFTIFYSLTITPLALPPKKAQKIIPPIVPASTKQQD